MIFEVRFVVIFKTTTSCKGNDRLSQQRIFIFAWINITRLPGKCIHMHTTNVQNACPPHCDLRNVIDRQWPLERRTAILASGVRLSWVMRIVIKPTTDCDTCEIFAISVKTIARPLRGADSLGPGNCAKRKFRTCLWELFFRFELPSKCFTSWAKLAFHANPLWPEGVSKRRFHWNVAVYRTRSGFSTQFGIVK